MLELATRARYFARQEVAAAAVAPMLAAWHRALNPDMTVPPPRAALALKRRHRALLRADFADAEAGLYPKALVFEPGIVAQLPMLPSLAREIPRIFRRRRDGVTRELPAGVREGDYPAYYLRNFHWQTDGWLSERSARIYDAQVEFLFFGAAAPMRRRALGPLVTALRDQRGARVADIACGTGAFLGQLHQALPEAKLYGVDLSGPYLREASRRLAHVPELSLLCENAEALPLADGSLAAAHSCFLFHELPPKARRNVAKEIARALAPGGTFVAVDSLQRADEGADDLRWYLDFFPETYHEPFYRGYLEDELGAMFEEAGLCVTRRESHFLAKLVVAEKR
ncbi:MAG: class I SAM-dependent methyltransferase [Deltaproteobacteria bacterium]